MISAEQNDLITRVGAGTPCGRLLRRYWQPVALGYELRGERPVKAVRLLGEDLVLYKAGAGYGLMQRHCPHRGADLAYGRLEPDGLRCSFHGWKFDAAGKCVQTPAEPEGSRMCEQIRTAAYPVVEKTYDIGQSARDPYTGFDMGYYGDKRYVVWGGGIPVFYENRVIGAIAVSGLMERENIELAKFGRDALGING